MSQLPPTRRLSTGTLFFKKVFPPMMIAAALLVPVVRLIRSDGFLEVIPVSVALIAAYFVTKAIGEGLADEVLDGGDRLIVRKDDGELEIPFNQIEVIKESSWVRNPPRVQLILKAPGPLGRVIAFIPASYSLVPFAKSAIFHELTHRLEVARRQEGRGAPRAQLERDLC